MNVCFMIGLIVQASACVINNGDSRRQGGGMGGGGMGGGGMGGGGMGVPGGMGGGAMGGGAMGGPGGMGDPGGMGGGGMGGPGGMGGSGMGGPGGDGEPVLYTGYGMEEMLMTTQQQLSTLRFARPTSPTTRGTTKRTIPTRVTDFEEGCDYLAFYCLKAYKTGKLCGRTVYFQYKDFKNYCMLDFVNCMERYEVWQVAHMGECFNLTNNNELGFQHLEYHDDYFLDQYFVIEV